MKKKRWYEIPILLLVLILTAVGLYRAGTALLPKRYDYGAVWETYLQEEKNTVDILFLGSSMVYCDIVPAQLYEKTGLTGFVMAGPEQTLPVTAEYLRECLKTQSPQLVMLDVTGAFFNECTNYSPVNVCYMPFGLPRVCAANACEEGTLRAALFPLYEFHNAIFEEHEKPEIPLEEQKAQSRMECGYTFLSEARLQTESKEREFSTTPGSETYEKNLSAIRQMAADCEKDGIRLLLYISPATEQIPAAWRTQLLDDLRGLSREAIEDWTDLSATIGIDDRTDWYDGLHYNAAGAEKFTAYLSEYLKDLSLTPTGKEDSALWQSRVQWWQEILTP